MQAESLHPLIHGSLHFDIYPNTIGKIILFILTQPKNEC